jgi:hypothetical protein
MKQKKWYVLVYCVPLTNAFLKNFNAMLTIKSMVCSCYTGSIQLFIFCFNTYLIKEIVLYILTYCVYELDQSIPKELYVLSIFKLMGPFGCSSFVSYFTVSESLLNLYYLLDIAGLELIVEFYKLR